ncbi:GNAT family N-acetyltransferase [Pseudobutyrivibrio sp. LB2011]|uniref:GNAT family N-acetyltransferase n=1 Tax=Pseudobutyrivibrio sp. LB2011 TaxID=1408312 RepID=UPI0005D237BE|nr:GNAT family N-acetyltransferase [Pseudobutyrivibrio sp. LB2011]
MNFDIKTISSKQAESLGEYIFPPVLGSQGFSDYGFYIAIQDKELLGMAVIDPKPDMIEVLSLAVNPKYEGQGVATDLLRGALEKTMTLYDSDMAMDTIFYATFSSEFKCSAALAKILEKLGFEQFDTGAFQTVTVKQLKESENLNIPSVKEKVNKRIASNRIVPLKEMSKKSVSDFLYDLSEKKEVVDRLNSDNLDEDISLFTVDDGKITACILFEEMQEDIIQNVLVYQVPRNDIKKVELMYLLSAAASAIAEKYPADVEVSFLAANEASDKLLDNLFDSTKDSGKQLIYAMDFEAAMVMQGEERFHSDLHFQGITLENMVCKSCKHCQDSILECAKFYQKPDRVLDGEECSYFETK